jgi:hypothetical protein
MSGSNLPRTALLLASLSLTGGAALAAPASPFIAMAGTWSGGGVLSTTDGQQEQLRCRAAYDVAGAGDQLRLNLTCASASYKFDLASEVEYRGGATRRQLFGQPVADDAWRKADGVDPAAGHQYHVRLACAEPALAARRHDIRGVLLRYRDARSDPRPCQHGLTVAACPAYPCRSDAASANAPRRLRAGRS